MPLGHIAGTNTSFTCSDLADLNEPVFSSLDPAEFKGQSVQTAICVLQVAAGTVKLLFLIWPLWPLINPIAAASELSLSQRGRSPSQHLVGLNAWEPEEKHCRCVGQRVIEWIVGLLRASCQVFTGRTKSRHCTCTNTEQQWWHAHKDNPYMVWCSYRKGRNVVISHLYNIWTFHPDSCMVTEIVGWEFKEYKLPIVL